MATNCFDDSCSVEFSQAGGLFVADVILQDIGSLVCGDGQGLAVNLVNDAETAPVNACANILRRDNSGFGQLFAELPSAVIQSFNDGTAEEVDDSEEIPGGGFGQRSPTVHAYTNNTGCEALVLVEGQFDLRYAVLGPDSTANSGELIRVGALEFPLVTGGDGPQDVVPFNAMWNARLLADIIVGSPTTARVTNKFATTGMMTTFAGPGAGTHQFQQERRTFSWATAVPAGSTLSIQGDIGHEGSDQTLNVVARDTADLALTDMGFRLDQGRFIAIPLPVA